MTWEIVIGLEVHVQLSTQSKIFSGSSTEYGASPNSQACAIDLGLPGVLPVLNRDAVKKAVKFGLAIGAEIINYSTFARKHYFYPDLPKGYQITQNKLPIVGLGHIDIQLDEDNTKRIGITRAHLEEDAGKSLHEDFHGQSGIDLNRAGIPLLEIVSEPDFRSAEEAVIYLKNLHRLVRYLDISDGNMQEGSFRCDANVSVRRKGQPLGTRTEIKNINSFRFVEKGIIYEANRQIAVLESGGTIRQETRLYDSDRDETRPMRAKETENDYRYFPDPDLLPIQLTDEFIDSIKSTLPELPTAKLKRFQDEYQLSAYDADILASEPNLADYFEDVAKQTDATAKLAVNWILGELAAALNKNNLEIKDSPIATKALADLLTRIHDQTISGKIGKTVFESLWTQEGSVDEIIEKKNLKQLTDPALIEDMIDKVLAKFPEQLLQFQSGKEKLFGFFVGQVMKETKGRANPSQLNEILKKCLQKTPR